MSDDPYAETRRAGPPERAKPPPRWRRGGDRTDAALRSAAAARAVRARERLPGGVPEGHNTVRAPSEIPGLAALGRAATGQKPLERGVQPPPSDVRPFRVIESHPGSGVRPVGSSGGRLGGHSRVADPPEPTAQIEAVDGQPGAAVGGRSGGPDVGPSVERFAGPAGRASVGLGPPVGGATAPGPPVVGSGGLSGHFGRRQPSALAAGMTRPLRSGRSRSGGSWVARSGMPSWRKPLAAVLVTALLAGVFVAVQAFRGVPRPSLVVGTQASFRIPGTPPVLPWPSSGEAEIEVAGVGAFGPVGGDTPVAIGSVAKIMVAYVVLKDHPLAPGSQGPSIPITPADVTTYQNDASQGDSVVPVIAGQSLTELQALQALLVPSGDNIAELLAFWDSGSEAAFVAKMNGEAASLGMIHTHYADASGLAPGTVSTPPDQLILAPLAMANATFAATVGMTQIDLPGAGVFDNFNTLLGTDGIDGIKTGSVSSGDLVFAAKHTVGGHSETIYGAVLGVVPAPGQGDIAAATTASQLLVKGVENDVKPVSVLPSGSVEAHVTAPWLSSPVPVATASPVMALGVAGLAVRVRVSPKAALGDGLPSDELVGHATVTVGSQSSVVGLRTTAPVPGPSLAWKLGRL